MDSVRRGAFSTWRWAGNVARFAPGADGARDRLVGTSRPMGELIDSQTGRVAMRESVVAFDISPQKAVADIPLSVRLTGMQPEQPVTIRATIANI